MGTWKPSHISGRYIYEFLNDFASATANGTLDHNGSFRLGFQIKPDRNYINSVIWCKAVSNNPDTPTNTTFLIKMVNGALRFIMSDGTKFYAFTSDLALFRTYKPVQVDVVYDNVNKTIILYADGVTKAYTTYNPDSNYYSSLSSFGNLNITSTGDFVFGKATGEVPFKGDLCGALYNNRIFESFEIFDYYNIVKDDISVAPTGQIVFQSKRDDHTSTWQLYTCDRYGDQQSKLFSTANNIEYPAFSKDGSRLTYTNSNENYCYTSLNNSSSASRVTPSLRSKYENNNNNILAIYYNYYGANHNEIFEGNYGSVDSGIAIGANNGWSKLWVDSNNDDSKILWSEQNVSSPTSQRLQIQNFNGTGVIVLNSITTISGSIEGFYNPRFSHDGTKIGFSKLVNDIYQIFTINPDGANLTQITALPYNCYFNAFSPDGTQILASFSNGISGKGQLHVMNVNGTNIINISKNSHDDFHGDWR